LRSDVFVLSEALTVLAETQFLRLAEGCSGKHA